MKHVHITQLRQMCNIGIKDLLQKFTKLLKVLTIYNVFFLFFTNFIDYKVHFFLDIKSCIFLGNIYKIYLNYEIHALK